MTKLFQKWLIEAAIAFIVRQLTKYQKTIDWAKVKADLAARVAALVPGEFFDHDAIEMVNALIDAVAKVLTFEKSFQLVLSLLAEEKYPQAIEALRNLLLKAWKADTIVAEKAKSLIEMKMV